MLRHEPQHDHIIRIFVRALWAARVAVFSAVGALVVFWKLPQARDLLMELRGGMVETTFYWVLFYVAVTILWLLPVYCASRVALASRQDWIGVQRHATLTPKRRAILTPLSREPISC